ncbi:Armadillo-type fold [Naviculisporaceae sp. PSN 640]
MEPEQIPLPSSLPEVENLIKALYQPNSSPESIAQIQSVLHRLQRSDEGWRLAQDLFQNREDSIRFYAILTIIVKLNNGSEALTDDLAKELLSTLISWVLQALAEGSAAFVIKKLCVALVTFFQNWPSLWAHCLRHFIYCLDVGHPVPPESVDEKLPITVLVEGLEVPKLKVAIWFAATLVEKAASAVQTLRAAQNLQAVLERTVKTGPDVGCLLTRGFGAQNIPGSPIHSDTLACFQSWVLYAQRAPASISDVLLGPLRHLVEPALLCLGSPELLNGAAEFFSDILTNYSSFFTPSHYQALFTMLTSPWAEGQYSQLVHGKSHEEDGIAFGMLLLAYGEAKVVELMKSTDQNAQNFLSKLVGLLAADGFAVAEDHIFVPALEFWSSFAETMVDLVYTETDEEAAPPGVASWKTYADEHIRNVVINCWRKIQWPPLDQFHEWDSSERMGFSDARKDVADLLQSVFPRMGKALVGYLVSAYQSSIKSQSWVEIEASMYCLSALSDSISEDEDSDVMLGQVFDAAFFKMMTAGTNSGVEGDLAPYRLKQTGVQLIDRYKEYFVRNSHHLFEALNLLFRSVNDPILGSASARAFSSLCLSSAPKLVGQADTLVGEYKVLRENRHMPLDPLAEEKVILGITGIIQAIPKGNDQRLEIFWSLYSLLKGDFERAINLKEDASQLNLDDPNYWRGVVVEAISNPSHSNWMMRNNDRLQQYKQIAASQAEGGASEDIALQIAIRSLRCLSSMAKGMQDNVENSVDVDARAVSPVETKGADKLILIQRDIISTMAQLRRTFPSSGEVADCVYNIYRAGFSETDPGPFVFPPDSVVDFFVVQRGENSINGDPAIMKTPRLGGLLSTACSFIGSLHGTPDSIVRPQLARLLPWVISLLQEMGEPESDVELAQNAIGFVQRVMVKYPDLFFMIQPEALLEFFFLFTLKALGGKEPLPKVAAADFWSAFLSLKPNYSHTSALSPDQINQLIATAMENRLGPLVAQTLVDNVGGDAYRSEIVKVGEPLRKLIMNHVHAQQWLQAALFREDFPATNIGADAKMLFLKKIVGLRGAAKETNEVFKEFWSTCRNRKVLDV